MFINGRFIPRSLCTFIEGDDTPAGGATDLSKVLDSFNSRLKKHNDDATALAQQLFTENYDLRDERRKLKIKVTELEGKAPAAGAVVLTADEATAWEAIKALNLTPEQIKQKLQSSTATETELAGLKRKEIIREASELEGFKPNVLATLLAVDIPIEFKELEADGQKRRAAFVKVKENGVDKEVSLADYVESTHKDFLPALKAEPVTQTRFVRQETQGKAPSANPYDRIREEAKARQEAQKTDNKPLEKRLGMA